MCMLGAWWVAAHAIVGSEGVLLPAKEHGLGSVFEEKTEGEGAAGEIAQAKS